MQFMALKAKTMDALEKEKERYQKAGWNKSTPEMKIFEDGEYWYYVCVFKNGKPEPRYTAKEITQAREWLIEVCSPFADRDCAGCPIGDPCDFCSVDGLNNVMRAWKEAKAHDKS